MELALLVYGISVISSFAAFCVFICVCLVIVIIFKLVAYDFIPSYNRAENQWEITKKSILKYIVAFILVSFTSVLIPSEKTMYVMVGAYAAQKVAQAPETKVISAKVLKVIEQKIDEQIKEVADKKLK